MFLACYIFPSSSSTLAAAIHPEALFGLLVITDFKRERAFLMSLISWAELNVRLSKSVMYPSLFKEGVRDVTDSLDALSNFIDNS